MMAAQQAVPVPDRELVARMAVGEERALAELYDRHSSAAYALALAIVREQADAEEVVADTFLQAWRTAERFDPLRGSVGVWLMTMARTRALDLLRARGRRARMLDQLAATAPDVAVSGAVPAPDRRLEQEDARRLVTTSLATLPQPQRRVIELAFFAGLSQSEIARELDEPLGTVKTRMRAGMEKLRDSLRSLWTEPVDAAWSVPTTAAATPGTGRPEHG